ncbi:B12-binding domain-containing radical SAM protein [Candidatus Woesearchaeota archaeon]|nr:B12-binding domain-containing radical SAM protein [Candidatus Woesearchaeota archaeon]
MPIVVGGIHPSLPEFTPHVIRDPNIDYVVMGEGELRIVALMNAIKEGKNPEFDGVAYKKESGDVEIITNRQIKARGGLVGNLEGYVRFDELPLPARDLIDMERYFEIGVPMGPFTHGYRPDQIMTSRGCPYECNFCATVEYWGRLMRNRSPENVLREVDDLVKRYGVDEIQWADDNLTARSREAKQIFNGLIERGYPLKWATPNGLMLRSMFEKNGEGPVDNEMVDLMARSGAYQVTFAVESGSQRVLRDIVHKPVPEQHRVRDLVDRIHGTGVKVHGMFIVGFPGEKPEEVEMTLRYPAETGFDSASIFIACPMPGSRLYDEAKREGWITDELIGGDLKTAHMTIPRSDPRFVMEKEELEELVDKRLKEFNALRLQKDPEWHEKKFRVYREKQQAIRKKYGPTAGDTIDIYGRVT